MTIAFIAMLLVASPTPSDSRQMVLAVSAGWDTTTTRVQRFERSTASAAWRARGAAVDASLGRSGLAWGRGLHEAPAQGPVKKEGDGRSPAGVFDLRVATGYDPRAPKGTRVEYRQATATLRCVDDASSRWYNQLVDESATAKDWSSAEDMRRSDDLYRLTVWVGHNDAPASPGSGSCIFLHFRRGKGDTTVGCTAFDAKAMRSLFAWLDPKKRPVLIQLPRHEYEALRRGWSLPAIR